MNRSTVMPCSTMTCDSSVAGKSPALPAAILVSLVVSLTTTPMMCARLLLPAAARRTNRFHDWSERGFRTLLRGYERTLAWALDHGPLTAGAVNQTPDCIAYQVLALTWMIGAGELIT